MSSQDETVLSGGQVVTPEGYLDHGTVVVDGDRITAVEEEPRTDPTVETTGHLVLPGLIDLHGDDIERHLFPRAEDRVSPERAVERCDQATVAAGVTTKCHALAFEDAPDDNRTLDLAETVAATIQRYADSGRALADHRLHLRCEVSSADSVQSVCARIDDPGVALASLVNHVPGEGQFDSPDEYAKRFDGGEAVSADEMAELVEHRSGVPDRTRRARAARVVARASDAGVPVAVHDSTDPDRVQEQAEAGVALCEFPVNLAAARAASDAGLTTAMGAPNLVRGESIWDNLSAMRAIDAGTVDLLCSDFRPQALLDSVFVETGEPLATRVERVTAAPADAIGLDDRGRIEPGARADLIVVDPTPRPRVVRAFVGGTETYRIATGP